jgi:hypothetical protein
MKGCAGLVAGGRDKQMETIWWTGRIYVFQGGQKYTLTDADGSVIKEITEAEAREIQYRRVHILQPPKGCVMGMMMRQHTPDAYDIEYTTIGMKFKKV